MGYTIKIMREPGFWEDEDAGRPLLQMRPEVVHAVIKADPTLEFVPDTRGSDYGDIVYIGNPNPEEVEDDASVIWFNRCYLTAKYPSTFLMQKMLELSLKLNAHMIGDNGEFYYFNKDGELYASDGDRDTSFIIGDKGTRYDVMYDGKLKNPNLLPDYLAENSASFEDAIRKKIEKKAQLPAGQVRLYGPVSSLCSEFAKFYETNNREFVVVYYEAFLGLVSGWNYANKDTPEKLIPLPEDNEAVTNEDIVFLYGYCKSFPRNKFVLACCALMTMRSGKTLKIPKFI